MLACVVVVLLLPAAVEEPALRAELETLERRYATQPGADVEHAAEALIARAPTSETAGRALVWLGALAQHAHHNAVARARYGEALRRFPHGEVGALAARGLGDVALAAGRWREALDRYDQALADASPLLALELGEKRAIARRERARGRVEIFAWAVLAACFAWLGWPSRRPRVAIPRDTIFLLPVYALLLAAAWGRDPRVPQAMLWIAVGSLALVTAGRRPAVHPRPLVDAAVLAVGNLAVLYIGLRRAAVLDALVETFRGAAAS